MSELEALWLGLVQGLTEFLPVSSSGHLVMFQTWFGLGKDGGLLFEVGLHVATLFAIVIVYRRRVTELVTGALRGRGDAWRYGGKLALATLPAVAVALVARGVVEAAFDLPAVTGVCLLLTGAALWTTRRSEVGVGSPEPGWGAAFAIGVVQAFALLPGISRSGSTVAAALALGVAPAAAAEFSFLLGIVAISGAAVLELPDVAIASDSVLGAVAIGGAAALVSGVVAIRLFLRLLDRHSFHLFAYYAWAAGGLFLAWLALR